MDRRQVIAKGAAAAVAAGVVWSAPRVEGLSIRPSYAAAGSGGALQTVDYPAGTGLAAFPCAQGNGELRILTTGIGVGTMTGSVALVKDAANDALADMGSIVAVNVDTVAPFWTINVPGATPIASPPATSLRADYSPTPDAPFGGSPVWHVTFRCC